MAAPPRYPRAAIEDRLELHPRSAPPRSASSSPPPVSLSNASNSNASNSNTSNSNASNSNASNSNASISNASVSNASISTAPSSPPQPTTALINTPLSDLLRERTAIEPIRHVVPTLWSLLESAISDLNLPPATLPLPCASAPASTATHNHGNHTSAITALSSASPTQNANAPPVRSNGMRQTTTLVVPDISNAMSSSQLFPNVLATRLVRAHSTPLPQSAPPSVCTPMMTPPIKTRPPLSPFYPLQVNESNLLNDANDHLHHHQHHQHQHRHHGSHSSQNLASLSHDALSLLSTAVPLSLSHSSGNQSVSSSVLNGTNSASGVARKRVKIPVPAERFPEFNFVGRLLGPRGTTLKTLARETGCKIMIRGKGSIRKDKEQDVRHKPGYEHVFTEPLHVVIEAADINDEFIAMRALQRAKEAVEMLLIPVPEEQDGLKRQQLRALAIMNGTYRGSGGLASVNSNNNNNNSNGSNNNNSNNINNINNSNTNNNIHNIRNIHNNSNNNNGNNANNDLIGASRSIDGLLNCYMGMHESFDVNIKDTKSSGDLSVLIASADGDSDSHQEIASGSNGFLPVHQQQQQFGHGNHRFFEGTGIELHAQASPPPQAPSSSLHLMDGAEDYDMIFRAENRPAFRRHHSQPIEPMMSMSLLRRPHVGHEEWTSDLKGGGNAQAMSMDNLTTSSLDDNTTSESSPASEDDNNNGNNNGSNRKGGTKEKGFGMGLIIGQEFYNGAFSNDGDGSGWDKQRVSFQ